MKNSFKDKSDTIQMNELNEAFCFPPNVKPSPFCQNIHIKNTNRMTVSINIPFNSHMYVSYPSLVNTVYLSTVIFL